MTPQRHWPVPTALVGLSAIPVTAGTLRLIELAGGPAVLPANERFGRIPVPLVLHIGGAAIYALVGIGQFLPRLRLRHPYWHCRAGRLLAVAGLLVAVRSSTTPTMRAPGSSPSHRPDHASQPVSSTSPARPGSEPCQPHT